MRQAFAGMLWSKQLYDYDVARWLDGDPTQPRAAGVAARPAATPAGATSTPSTSCRCPTNGSTRGSRRGTSRFHCVALAHVDPASPSTSCAALPRVVPAPQRRAARLRVGLRRCQPAGAGVGGARGVRHRRRSRPRLPEPHLRQAARQLHLVGEPPGRRRLEPLRGRLPRARQHRAARPLAPAGRAHAGAVRRHRLDGVLRAGHGGHRGDPATARARPATDLVLKFLEHFARITRGDGRPGPVGRRRTASTTTSCDRPTARQCR